MKAKQSSLKILLGFVITIFLLGNYIGHTKPHDGLKVVFLDVGQGDAIYIESPNGRQMMVDGGPRGSIQEALQTLMPYGDTSIDILMVTNPDVDHFAGYLDLLKKYEIGLIIEPGTRSTSKTYQEFQALIHEKQIPKIIARRGMEIQLDPIAQVRFDVLFPDHNVSGWNRNDGSIVGRLVYKENSFMLTGDSTMLTESIIRVRNEQARIESDVLKVGHHGSKTSTSSAFLEAVRPTFAVISSGKKNQYGHPHQVTIDRLSEYGITPLLTRDVGTITFLSNGTTLTYTTEMNN